MNLSNQRVVIIGGTSGMGLETARMLAASGAQVVISGRTREKVELVLAGIEGAVTGEVVIAKSQEDTTAFFQRVGSFDHLVLTPGGNEGSGHFRTLDLALLRRAFDGKFWPLVIAAQTSLDFIRKDGLIPRPCLNPFWLVLVGCFVRPTPDHTPYLSQLLERRQ